MSEQLLTIREAAKYLQVTPHTLKNYIRRADGLKVVKFGPAKSKAAIRVHVEDLREFVDNHRS